MKTHPAKRIEIVIEAPMQKRLTNALNDAGVSGYTVLPVRGGGGRSGNWTREGQVSRANGMVMIVCIVREELMQQALEKAFSIVEKHIGVVSITDCDVLRAELF
jgi:nitrogen regulatory protein PII